MSSIAINAKQKKDNEFIEKITKLYSEFCDKKKEYEKALAQMESFKKQGRKGHSSEIIETTLSLQKTEGRQGDSNKTK